MARRTLVVELVADSSSLDRALGRTSRGASKLEKDLSKTSRGLIAGSGVAHSFGRSLAFASGGFLAFSGLAGFISKSVDAAQEAQVAQRQLGQQLANNGKVYADYREQINKTVDDLSALSGIQNDELLNGLTTILRTTPDVSKALRDLGTAADLARAKHIALSAAATIIAKTEAGNTTLLRRQGIQIAKNATAEQALATLRRVVAGQARAGTTEQERFGAVLHQTEEEIGTGLLPVLNKYLRAGTRWLQQMNDQGKLQKDVSKKADELSKGVDDVASVIKTTDKVTGSFKNTLEILIGLKVAKWVGGMLGPFGSLVRTLGTSRGKTILLSESLAGPEGSLVVATGLASFGLTTLALHMTGADRLAGKLGGSIESLAEKLGLLAGAPDLGTTVPQGNPLLGQIGAHFTPDQVDKLRAAHPELSDHDFQILLAAAVNIASRPKGASGFASDARDRRDTGAVPPTPPKPLTVQQKNTFFDNAVARILLRGGLGDLQTQLGALQQAESLLTARIAKTKDITRKQKLEDQLLQLGVQEASVRQQIADDFMNGLQLNLEKAQTTAGMADDIAALTAINDQLQAEIKATGSTVDLQRQLFQNTQALRQARHDQTQRRLFGELGLGPTGEARVPGVAALRRRLGQLTKNIAGTFLDTAKTSKELDQIKHVLADKLLAGQPEVRAAIMATFDTMASQLQQSSQLPKFKHATLHALLAGLGLTPDQVRVLEQRLAQFGPGGKVPAGKSAAFSLAGAGDVVVHSHTYVDGREVATTVTKAQTKAATRRSGSRRGPYAGRH